MKQVETGNNRPDEFVGRHGKTKANKYRKQKLLRAMKT